MTLLAVAAGDVTLLLMGAAPSVSGVSAVGSEAAAAASTFSKESATHLVQLKVL